MPPCLIDAVNALAAAERLLSLAVRTGRHCRRCGQAIDGTRPTMRTADGATACPPCCDEERR